MNQFPDIYQELLLGLVAGPGVDREMNQRTGVAIRVAAPCSFTLDLHDGQLPMCGVRRTFPRTAAAEVAWFLQGRKEVDFIRRYAPIWDKFVEDDGQTVAGAYGHRWRNHFGRDQIADAIKALDANPSDRRIFISAWDPAEDGLGRPSKNVPCPVGFTLSVTGGRLNSTLLIRSSDVFVGLPYDVMGHALLMAAVLGSLNLQCLGTTLPRLSLGCMQVSLAHPHLYEPHLEMAKEAVDGPLIRAAPQMPRWFVNRIVSQPDAYVALVKEFADECPESRHPFHCRPELVV